MRKFNITVNGKSYEVDVEEIGGAVSAPVISAPVQAPAPAAAPAAAPAPKAAAPAGGTKINAPMPGTILSVKVKPGDSVKSDDVIAVLEAMKMENEIFAGADGTIASVNVSAGDAVNTGDLIASIS